MSTTTQIVCRLCGRNADEIKERGYLTRVNEKGIPGIWECRPSCQPASIDEWKLAAMRTGLYKTGTDVSTPELWRAAQAAAACRLLDITEKQDAELAKSRARIDELEGMLNEIFHHSSCTEHQMNLIESVLPQKVL